MFQDYYLSRVARMGIIRIGECPSIAPFLKKIWTEVPQGAEVPCFQGMERYEDIFLYKIHPPTTTTTSVYVMHKFIAIYYKL